MRACLVVWFCLVLVWFISAVRLSDISRTRGRLVSERGIYSAQGHIFQQEAE